MKLASKYILFATLLCNSMWRCITPFELSASETEGEKGLLVVNGFISDGNTSIRLGRSVGLRDDLSGADVWVGDADVWVESEDGQRFDAREQTDSERRTGRYLIPMGELDFETEYRLRISLDGEEYESEWRKPQKTPPISEVTIVPDTDKEVLRIMLDVDGEADDSRYYMWTYNEIWEIHSHQLASHYYGIKSEGELFYYSLYDYIYDGGRGISEMLYSNATSPFYYCWKYDTSKSILLGDASKMTDNILRDQVLFEFGFNDSDRLMSLYYTEVTQYALDDDAFHYYSTLKKNSEETGSIFAPILSEMEGNITCTTSPDIRVIGFVEVSQHTVNHQYSNDSMSVLYTVPAHNCETKNNIDDIRSPEESRKYYLIRIIYEENGGYVPEPVAWTWAQQDCIDCRRQGGTKTRPSFWPNDHF